MKTFQMLFAMVTCTTMLTSCATLFCKPQTVTVTSDVEGADVYMGSKYVGKTPLTYNTKKTVMTIALKKKGYEPQAVLTNRSVKGVVWLDCLAGGIPGFVDLFSGRYYKYKETEYFVSMNDPRINEAHNDRINRKYAWVGTVGQIASVAQSGLDAYGNAKQAEYARNAEERRMKEAQQQAAAQQRVQQYSQARSSSLYNSNNTSQSASSASVQQGTQTVNAIFPSLNSSGLSNILIRISNGYVVAVYAGRDYQGRQIWDDISPVKIYPNSGNTAITSDPNTNREISMKKNKALVGQMTVYF